MLIPVLESGGPVDVPRQAAVLIQFLQLVTTIQKFFIFRNTKYRYAPPTAPVREGPPGQLVSTDTQRTGSFAYTCGMHRPLSPFAHPSGSSLFSFFSIRNWGGTAIGRETSEWRPRRYTVTGDIFVQPLRQGTGMARTEPHVGGLTGTPELREG